MDNKDLQDLLVRENPAVSETDARHVANYKNLIAFIEGAIAEGSGDISKLTSACVKLIRYLDQVIVSYEKQEMVAKERNALLNFLIQKNTGEKKEALEEKELTKTSESLEIDL